MAKRPRDPNQLAKLIVDIAAGKLRNGDAAKSQPSPKRKGGLTGGAARAKNLTEAEHARHSTLGCEGTVEEAKLDKFFFLFLTGIFRLHSFHL